MTQQPPLGTQPQRPGQMTAVMRAMPQATGPKVLRIGLVQGGKVIEERVIKQRTHVTVGPSEKSTFVLPTKSLPPTFKLFELVGSDYVLNFLDGMTGRVALKTGISDLGALRAQAKRVQQGPVTSYQIQLNEDARGKVVVGETTFLFQFVAPPPVQPRPQLPVSVKSGVEIDWTTTIIAAFSFLFHFGLIGSIYSDWMDPPVDDDLSVAQLIESVKQLPPPPPVEQKEETPVLAEATATAAAAEKEAPKAAGATGQKGAGSPGKGAGNMSDARASQLSNELAQLDVAMLASLNSGGVATDRVLSNSEVPFALLDQAAASGAAAGRGKVGGLDMGGGSGGAYVPGAGGGGGLSGLGNKGQGEGAAGAGSAKAVKGPTGSASVGGASVSGGNVANAASVVAGMAAGFRRCYNRGLQEDPSMKGSVRITAKIGPNGEVLGATPSGGGGLSGTVISCVVSRVASAQFAAPEGGGATIVIPISFASQ
ncbi:MAG: cell envelope integrity protein TolA [Myxococcales bacterium]|nr:cell envelope integrity protein TolA [Myxococcales bacterium]